MNPDYPNFPLPVLHEYLSFMLKGEEIGRGATRIVYAVPHAPHMVMKVDDLSGGSFHNVIEYRVWHAVKGTPNEVHFAPCHGISVGGNFLFMERTQPIEEKDMPASVPDFLRDAFPKNFGWIGRGKSRRIVCHDYGHTSIFDALEKAPLAAPNKDA